LKNSEHQAALGIVAATLILVAKAVFLR
jgi:hypothetical protein